MRIEKKTLNDAMRVLGKVVKFVLFFTSRCVFWKRKAAGWKLKESCATRMPRMWFGYGKNVIGKIP